MLISERNDCRARLNQLEMRYREESDRAHRHEMKKLELELRVAELHDQCEQYDARRREAIEESTKYRDELHRTRVVIPTEVTNGMSTSVITGDEAAELYGEGSLPHMIMKGMNKSDGGDAFKVVELGEDEDPIPFVNPEDMDDADFLRSLAGIEKFRKPIKRRLLVMAEKEDWLKRTAGMFSQALELPCPFPGEDEGIKGPLPNGDNE